MEKPVQYITPDLINYQLANLSQLVFEVTDACNLNCKYCGFGEFYGNYEVREDKNLSIEKALTLIDYLVGFWNTTQNASARRNVYISFYGGEPLLNMPFIKAIVSHVEKLDCKHRFFTFSMTTNALLLSKNMDYLVEKDFNLLISLDGDAENTAYRVDHNQQPAFSRIVKNVDAIRQAYPDYFENKVQFNSVLHNKNSVEQIYQFFKENYNKIPTIGEVNTMGIKPEMQEQFRNMYQNVNESLSQSEHYREIERDMFINSASYQTLCTFIHQYSGFVYHDYTDLLFEKKAAPKIPSGTCIPFSKKMYVTVNGKILPCERIGHQFALGEITDQEVVLDVDAISEKYNHYLSKVEKQCSKCNNTKACTQCIFYLEDIDAKPVCEGFMNEENFRAYYLSQMAFLAENPDAYYRIMEEIVVE